MLVDDEAGRVQRRLKSFCVDRPAGDLEVDLHVDVRGAGVRDRGAAAEQVRYEAAEQNELRRRRIGDHDPPEGCLGELARPPATNRFQHDGPPEGVARLQLGGLPERQGRRILAPAARSERRRRPDPTR